MANPPAKPPERALADEDFRRMFHKQRMTLTREYGVEAYDQGEVLYRCNNCQAPIVVRDAFYGREPTGPVEEFQAELASRWFGARATLQSDACKKCRAPGPLPARRALYAHFLPEVGFDFTFEIEPAGAFAPPGGPVENTGGPVDAARAARAAASAKSEPEIAEFPAAAVTRCWRMDARGRVTRVAGLRSELDFRDQTGTFFDLRAGWRELVATWRQGTSTRRAGGLPVTAVAEVQSGYIIGVRVGVPGDPNPEQRHDPELEQHFGRYERRTYDTVEFLGRTDPANTPFHGELFDEWCGEIASEVSAGRVELFVLADSSEFLACLEDFCAHRGVAVEWIEPDTDLRVAFHLGDLRVEAAFAYPFLRTLHTGRTFHAGARAFYAPIVTALEDASDILEIVEQEVKGHTTDVIDGTLLRIRVADDSEGPDAGREVGRWNLMTIAGRLAFRGEEGVTALMNLLGYDRERQAFRPMRVALDQCPLCGERARVGKVLRPSALLGLDKSTLVGADVGEHFLLYTQECSLHSTPVQAGPGRTLASLEAAWEAGLAQARLVLVEARSATVGQAVVTLLVGFETGSLVLEPARLKRALEIGGDESTPTEGIVSVYAFFPDAVVVARAPLDAPARRDARLLALESLQPRFPARIWPLDVARRITLPKDGVGVVERPA